MASAAAAYVVSLEGEVIAHSDPALVLARGKYCDRPEFAEMLAAPDYKWHGSYRNFQNVDVVGSSAGVAEGEDLRPDWIVVTELPRWEAYAATRTALIVIGGSLFAPLMLVGWVSAQLADRRFLHPLDRLSEGAARFGRGELEYRIHLPHRDEIGKLGEAFNAMGSQLELRQAELLEAETRLRNIVEGLPGIAYVAEFGEYGAWLYVSPQIESILGYPPQEWQADPQLWSRCVHPEDRRKVLEDESNQWERSPDRHHTIEYRLLARDGRLVWVRDEYVTLRDENGVPRLWQGVLYDITDRKQAEQAPRRREAILSAVGYAAERFLQAPRLCRIHPGRAGTAGAGGRREPHLHLREPPRRRRNPVQPALRVGRAGRRAADRKRRFPKLFHTLERLRQVGGNARRGSGGSWSH
ncbi:MAG: PAS domain-containing protein [Chloroflexi bacterium]|nr:PAS domain-containing protein [Chloroflexota bacterium]